MYVPLIHLYVVCMFTFTSVPIEFCQHSQHGRSPVTFNHFNKAISIIFQYILPVVYCCHVLSLNSACPENTYLVVVQYSPQYMIECVKCPENSASQRGIGKSCPCIEGFGRIKDSNASSPCVGECQYVCVFDSTLSCCLYKGIHECMVCCVS